MKVIMNSQSVTESARQKPPLPAPVALLVASWYALPGYGDQRVWVRGAGWLDHLCHVTAAYALRLNSRTGT